MVFYWVLVCLFLTRTLSVFYLTNQPFGNDANGTVYFIDILLVCDTARIVTLIRGRVNLSDADDIESKR